MSTQPARFPDETRDPPRRRDAARNRELLLAAAAEVFAEFGASASLKDVADRAGLGVGTVYRHMPDKDAVIVALLRPQLERLVAMTHEALREPATFERFADLTRRIAGEMAGSKALSEIVLYQHELPEELGAPVAAVLNSCAEVIARAQATGELRADLDTTDLVLCMTAAHTAETRFADLGAGASRRLLDLVLDGMRVRRDAPTPLSAPTFALGDLMAGSAVCRDSTR